MRIWKRIGCLLTALCTLWLAGCGTLLSAERQDRLRLLTAVPYANMAYTHPDMDALYEALNACTEEAETADKVHPLMAKINKYSTLYGDFLTNSALAAIHYYGDTEDAYWAEEFLFCQEQAAALQVPVREMLHTLAVSPLREQLEADAYFGPGYFDPYDGEDVWDDTMLELLQQEAQLENQYLELSARAMDAVDSQAQFVEQYGSELQDIYVSLVRLRRQMALYAGYDSYNAFAYDQLYTRHYTPAEAMDYLKRLSEEMDPAMLQAISLDQLDTLESPCSSEETLAYLKATADGMGGRIQAAYRFLEKTGTYDIDYRESKYGVSFQTYLYNYDSPFLFLTPGGTRTDQLTAVHEFGHYCGSYITSGGDTGLDVAEVQSQAMELLSLVYAEADGQLQMYALGQLAQVYLEQALYSCFEHKVYELEESGINGDSLQKLFAECVRSFGGQEVDGREYTLIPHLFIEPQYVISYVVSSDAALQLYEMELETPGDGLAAYGLCLERGDASLQDMIEACGLENPLAPNRPADARDFISRQTEKYRNPPAEKAAA